MSNIKTPGFTAEASLHGYGMNYQMVANSPDSRLQVTLALMRGTYGAGSSCTGDCASTANDCTYNCAPGDDDCRSKCDDNFWACVMGCNPYRAGGGLGGVAL